MIKFRTFSGSDYTIDIENKQWYRMYNPNSTDVRDSGSTYEYISAIEIGKPVVIVAPPFEEGNLARIVKTSKVVEIL